MIQAINLMEYVIFGLLNLVDVLEVREFIWKQIYLKLLIVGCKCKLD